MEEIFINRNVTLGELNVLQPVFAVSLQVPEACCAVASRLMVAGKPVPPQPLPSEAELAVARKTQENKNTDSEG